MRGRPFPLPADGFWGGCKPVYCPAELRKFELKLPPATEFCWDVDYGSYEISPEYAQFVKIAEPELDHEKALRFKFLGYRRYECVNRKCPVEAIWFPMFDAGSRHPHTSRKHASRCVSRAMSVIEELEKRTNVDYMLDFELTFPEFVSSRLPNPDLMKLVRKAARRFVRDLFLQLFRGRRSQPVGFFAVHVWATKRPTSRHLHVHLQLLNVARNPKTKQFHRFRPWVSEKLVKRVWARVLTAFSFWEPVGGLPDCHVKYIKLKNRSRVDHRIRYVFRRPIVDLNEFLIPEDLNGLDREWARYLLRYTPRYLTVGVMNKLDRICRKSVFERCPFCGSALVRLGYIMSNLPDLPHFARHRDGKWTGIPPPPVPGSDLVVSSI